MSVVRMLVIAGGWTRSGFKAEMPTKSVVVIKLDPLGNPLTTQGFQAEDLPSATLSCEKILHCCNAIDLLLDCLFTSAPSAVIDNGQTLLLMGGVHDMKIHRLKCSLINCNVTLLADRELTVERSGAVAYLLNDC